MTEAPAPFHIRLARADDADAITDFNLRMAHETEGKRLRPEVLGAGVRRMLAEAGMGFYLVAEAEGEAVASLMVTTEWSDWRNGRFWWIQSLYVVPAWRCRGVFRALYAEVKALAVRQGDVCGFRLYVEQDNARAFATYRSLGMDDTDYRIMEELRPGIVYLQQDAVDPG